MTIDEAIKHCEETAHQNEILMKRYDDASGYNRSRNEKIRTNAAKGCEQLISLYRQLAEWLRELKEYKDARVGCEYCKHKFREQHERPCSLCQRNFMDMFEREVNADEACD